MDKVKIFKRNTFSEFKSELKKVLEKFSKETGVDVKISRGAYRTTSATIELKAVIHGKDTFESEYCYAMTGAKIGDVINIPQLGKVKITDYVTRRPKYPVSVTCLKSNKDYKLQAGMIEAYI
tara:strand:- start:5 stop:370 length:366 start_codon:yes stop_codon:yes gene_type:complete